ncbi:MAG: LON peptidase substrate-binding domain-containing protein [Betaproteobacteria bacterium]|nr:LON peptidase substrate-binding domain-containing protein [Betaproteobacteria bacterium]
MNTGAQAQRIQNLPLFPLNAVLFPGGRLALKLFEQRYLEMAKECLRANGPFGVCLILEGSEVGEPAVPASVGCTARIANWDMPQLGMLNIRALGEQRFRVIERRVERNGLARAEVELLPLEPDAEVPPGLALGAQLLRRVLEDQTGDLTEPPYRYDSCSWVSARLAELLPLPLATKQALLELDGGLERLEALHVALKRSGAARPQS